MLKEKTLNFIKNQTLDLNDFTYTIDEDDNLLYIEFTEVLGEKKNIELTFKLLNEILYYHSLTYGWKPVEKGSNNKFFWIDLLN